MARQSFLKGAVILALASVVIRILGFIYQIIIIRLIGTEGIGIFNMVYPLYIAALVFVTAGLPLAISKFVSEETPLLRRASTENLLGSSVTILLILSVSVSFLLVFFSPQLITLLYADPRVIPSFMLLIPTLLVCALTSAIRSYFQGKQDMRPTAYSQLTEQIIRFITGIGLVWLFYPRGLTWAAVGLSLGILLSELGGLIYIHRYFKRFAPKVKLLLIPSLSTARRLFSFGIPVTVTRMVSTLFTAAEASIIPRQLLQAGGTLSQAASFYGELTGVAFTLLMVPSTLTFSLSTSIVPAVSEAESKNNRRELRQRSTEAIHITLLAGVPSALVLYCWGPAITQLLFRASLGGQLLQLLALGSVFLYVSQTSTGILQGLGRVKTIFFITLITGLIRLGGIYYFGSDPVNCIPGIALSYVASFIVGALLNIIFIIQNCGISFEPLFYLRLLFSGVILVHLLKVSVFLVQDNIPLMVLLILLYGILFFLALLATGDKYARFVLKQLFR